MENKNILDILIKKWIDYLLSIDVYLEKEDYNKFNYNVEITDNKFNYTIDIYYNEDIVDKYGFLIGYKLNRKQIMDINMYFKSKYILVYPDFESYKLSITIFLDEYINELRLKKINKLLKLTDKIYLI